MRVLFLGGPKDHETMEVRELLPLFVMPIQRELTIRDMITESTPLDGTFNMDTVIYRFTRQAIVNLKGEVEVVLYEFDGPKA